MDSRVRISAYRQAILMEIYPLIKRGTYGLMSDVINGTILAPHHVLAPEEEAEKHGTG